MQGRLPPASKSVPIPGSRSRSGSASPHRMVGSPVSDEEITPQEGFAAWQIMLVSSMVQFDEEKIKQSVSGERSESPTFAARARPEDATISVDVGMLSPKKLHAMMKKTGKALEDKDIQQIQDSVLQYLNKALKKQGYVTKADVKALRKQQGVKIDGVIKVMEFSVGSDERLTLTTNVLSDVNYTMLQHLKGDLTQSFLKKMNSFSPSDEQVEGMPYQVPLREQGSGSLPPVKRSEDVRALEEFEAGIRKIAEEARITKMRDQEQLQQFLFKQVKFTYSGTTKQAQEFVNDLRAARKKLQIPRACMRFLADSEGGTLDESLRRSPEHSSIQLKIVVDMTLPAFAYIPDNALKRAYREVQGDKEKAQEPSRRTEEEQRKFDKQRSEFLREKKRQEEKYEQYRKGSSPGEDSGEGRGRQKAASLDSVKQSKGGRSFFQGHE